MSCDSSTVTEQQLCKFTDLLAVFVRPNGRPGFSDCLGSHAITKKTMSLTYGRDISRPPLCRKHSPYVTDSCAQLTIVWD